MKKIKFLSLSLMLLFVFSCSEDTSNPETDTTADLTTLSSPQSSYASNNPFDYIGNIHNQFLAYSSTQDYGSLSQIQDASIQFSAEAGVDVSTLDYDLTLHGVTIAINSNMNQGLAIALQNGYITDNVYSQMQLVVNVLNEQNSPTPQILINSLNDLEAHFLSLNLNENDKNVLLLTIAVARHSAEYWIAYYTPASGGGASNASAIQAKKANWFSRVFGGAVADVLGAVIGGGIGTVIAPGPGSVAGAIIGGAAASGGIQAAITQ